MSSVSETGVRQKCELDWLAVLGLPPWHCKPVPVFRELNEPPQGFERLKPIACQPSDPTQLAPASLALCIGVPWSVPLTSDVDNMPLLTSQWLAPETE